MDEMDISSFRFASSVWERETQSYMPALIAKAVGKGEDGLQVKGVQVTFLDDEGNKASLDHPVRYTGSPDAIIMLQKPTQKDDRWFVAADLETGLKLIKKDNSIRVACLANEERFDRNPLEGKGKELVFCTQAHTSLKMIEKAREVFSNNGFRVSAMKIDEKISNKNLTKNVSKALQQEHEI